MKFSGIDMQGDFKAQIVADASALVYASSDERRMIYDETTNQLWIADDSGWKLMSTYSNIPQGSVMWVYADSAPTGWTLYSASGDRLVAIKGGATYTTGGTTAGSFTTPAHQHSMQNHTHLASGNTDTAPPQSEYDSSSSIFMREHYHPISITSNAPSTNLTTISGSQTGYRPRARVGILCTR